MRKIFGGTWIQVGWAIGSIRTPEPGRFVVKHVVEAHVKLVPYGELRYEYDGAVNGEPIEPDQKRPKPIKILKGTMAQEHVVFCALSENR